MGVFNLSVIKKIISNLEDKAKEVPLAFEIYIGKPIYYYSDLKLSPDKQYWIERKRNLCLRFGQSSLDVSIKNNNDIDYFEKKYGLSNEEFALAGGAIPIYLDGLVIGAVTVTGLTPEEDHNIAKMALEAGMNDI